MGKYAINSIFIIVSSLSFSLLTACGSDGDSDNEVDKRINCSGVVEFVDPLVQINSVMDASSGDELTQIKMSDLMIHGESRQFDQLNSDFLSRVDIIEDGDSAICTLPCTLFTEEGDYSMEVSATAFESKRIDFSPRYANFETDDSGCTTTVSGSYELTFSLEPAF